MDEKTQKLGARRWAAILLIGLIGQIAWAIENNYINLWVYSQSHNADHITWMTMASAVVATLTTFFIGALSDRIGKRKIFIALGYSIWGVTVFLFGVMSLPNMNILANSDAKTAVLLVGVMNVLVDCLMTFFGSTSNDACFNAFVTDETNQKNRPFVESVLSIMPLIALAMMLGLGAILGIPNKELSPEAAASPWFIFFLITGILTTGVGILAFFLLPKDHIAPNRDQGYFKHMLVGFFPKTIKANPLFYIALLAFMFFNIGVDSFMPYILVYFQNMNSFQGGDFYVGIGSIMGGAALIVIVFGLFLEKLGKLKVLIPSIAAMAGGALGLFFSGDSLGLGIVFGLLMMGGYLLGTAALGAEIRDLTPEGDVGAFQSVRMVFVVMIPMVVGSNLSSAVFQTPAALNDYGQMEKAPDRFMFLVTVGAALLTLAPVLWLLIANKKRKALAEETKNAEEQ